MKSRQTYTIYMEGVTYGCTKYPVSTETNLEQALEVYEQVRKLADRVGKSCWLTDDLEDEMIKFNI